MLYNENPRMDKQMDHALENQIPFLLFIGENEIKEKKVKIKCLFNGQEIVISRDLLIEEVLKLKSDPSLLHVKKNKEKSNKDK
jgi:histidyl-tRNA synthetase